MSVAKPGQWILLSSDFGANFENMPLLFQKFLKGITKARLDELAPNNPVRVKNSWIDGLLNTRGIEAIRKVFPDAQLEGRGNRSESGRQLEPDVILGNKTELNAALLKSEMQLWTAHGVTTFGSSPYAPGNFKALAWLDARKEMPARFAWGYSGPDLHFDTLRMVAAMLGHGSDYLWNVGAQGEESGGSCTTISATPQVKAREECAFNPGSTGRQVMEDIVRSGGRVATMHSGGDKDIDNLMDAIEKGSKEAGLTLEDIRKRRHAFDHGSGAPRPDQIPRIKRLGMMVSMINTVLWENRTDYDISFRVRNYGIEYAHWAVPRKSVTDAGIMNTQEIDRAAAALDVLQHLGRDDALQRRAPANLCAARSDRPDHAAESADHVGIALHPARNQARIARAGQARRLHRAGPRLHDRAPGRHSEHQGADDGRGRQDRPSAAATRHGNRQRTGRPDDVAD